MMIITLTTMTIAATKTSCTMKTRRGSSMQRTSMHTCKRSTFRKRRSNGGAMTEFRVSSCGYFQTARSKMVLPIVESSKKH